jgi:FixJ family two-component response regulator
MLTGNDDVELARRTLKLGAFDYVRKPFDLNYLGRSIFAQLVAGADETPEAGSGRRGDPS